MSAPLSLRWFLLLVFFRPLFDTLYELKHVSIFASPLYWIGILTPVFITLSILSKRSRIVGNISFSIWFVIVMLNSIIILLVGPSITDSLMTVLKISTIGLLYYYIRVMAVNETQYLLLMKCVAYSAIFVYAFIVLETVGLGGGGDRTSGGVEQMVGPFADAVSFGMYLNLTLSAWLYLYYKKMVYSKALLVSVLIITVYGVASIAHIASMALLLGILLIYLKSVLKERMGKVILGFIFFVVVGFSMTSDIFEARYQPKVDREFQVIRGERDDAQAFHGRMSRWNLMLPVWTDMSVLAKLLGVAFEMEGVRNHGFWVLIQPHNDFLRILFVSGILGLLLYLHWMYKNIRKSFKLTGADQFIAQSSIIVVAIYSITTLPTLYPAILYFVITTIGYVETNYDRMIENSSG